MFADWTPIAELPAYFKDGRQVLIWDKSEAVACRWRAGPEGSYYTGWDTGFASAMDGDPIMVASPTDFAPIYSPVEARLRAEAMRSMQAFCDKHDIASREFSEVEHDGLVSFTGKNAEGRAFRIGYQRPEG
jgi:hypothetical protein